MYSARYAGSGASDEDNNELLLRELANVDDERRTARFVCCLTFSVPGEGGPQRVAAAHGSIEGRIGRAPRGDLGFGYDPLFEPVAYPGSTTALLSPEDKDRISHRGQAARRLLGEISSWLDRQTSR